MIKKTIKFFRDCTIFAIVLSISFSNVPFYSLTKALDSYIVSKNIVDQAWHLSQEENVVDKFASFRNLLEKVKVYEAQAALSFVGSATASGTNTAYNLSLTALTGGVASSPTEGDIVVVVNTIVDTTNGDPGVGTAGYTELVDIYRGDTYDTNLSVSYKIMGATPDTTVSCNPSNSGTRASVCAAMVFSGVDLATPIDVTTVEGSAGNSEDVNCPMITPVTSGAIVLCTGGAAGASVDANPVEPSGYVGTYIQTDPGSAGAVVASYKIWSGVGAEVPSRYVMDLGTASANSWAAATLALRPASSAPTTSISNFVTAEPGNSSIAPGASGLVDSFGLVVNTGTDTVTGATVTLAAGTGARVATVAITNDGDIVTYCSVAPSGDIATLTGCGIPVTTTDTQFRVKVTAISHASMPAVPGASYDVTGTVTAFTSTNAQSGTDSGSSTLTIDNASPNGATAVSGTAGNAANTINWTTSNSADFDTTNGSVIYRWASGTAGSEVPTEGATPTLGSVNSTATVACLVSSAVSTAQSKTDGTGGSADCTTTALTNDQAYTYKAFQRDINGNYDAGVLIGTFTPSAPSPGARTYYMYYNTGTGLSQPPVTTNITCPVAADTTLTTTSGIGLLADVDDTSCVPGASRDVIWSSSAPTLSLYYNGSGYASAMDITGTSVGIRAKNQVSTVDVLTVKLFYTKSDNTKVYFSGTPPTTPAMNITRTEYQIDLSGLSATNVPAGSKIGVEFSWGDASGVRLAVNPTVTTEKLIVDEVVAAATTPILTGYTNSTETALNYAGACTGCGARIGGGAGFRQTVTIAGTGFGADPGVGNRSSATNNIKIGAQQIADTNVTAWSATSITFLTDSAVAGDTDTDWGAEFGGASALTVTASGATSAGLNFYVFPQVTSLSTCNSAGFPVGDGAREYDASDSVCPNGLTDGEIFLNGTRFGAASTGGYVQIFGLGATTPSWTNELIRARVPSSALYTGSLVVQQGVGSNNKTHTYTSTNFRIFPRITGFVPTSGSEGGSVTINGNHFCQGAGCPVAFDANNKVVFTSAVQATVFTSWSATSIVTSIPTGAVSGDVVVTSNSYTSNGKAFTVLSNTPTPPTSLNQWKNSGLTQAIAVGGVASSTPIYLTMIMEVPGISGGTLFPQVEYKAIGTAFACGAGACVSAVEGNGVAGPGPVDCGNTVNACAVSIAPTDEVYHWQARVRHNKGGSDYYSAWASFDGVNPETSTDFQIDTTAPGITNVSSGTPGTNSATITWNTSGEISTSRVEYDTAGTFTGGYDCAGTSECTVLADTSPRVNAHSVAFSNLSSGTIYYYRVRSKDAAGNESVSSNYSFTTASISQPAKTTKAYIDGAVGVVSAETTYYFTLNLPETTPAVQNAYVELFGVVSGGSGTIALQVNGAPARTYAVEATSPTLYRFLYRIPSPGTEANLNIEDAAPCTNGNPLGTPPCNKAIITPATVSMYVLSARIIATYAYTP